MLASQFLSDDVHRSARFRPLGSEIEHADGIEVATQKILKVLWRSDNVVVAGCRHGACDKEETPVSVANINFRIAAPTCPSHAVSRLSRRFDEHPI
jgi:hypothetical protein